MFDADALVRCLDRDLNCVPALFQFEFNGFGIHPFGLGVGDIDIHESSPVDAEQELPVHGNGADMRRECVLPGFGNFHGVTEQLRALALQTVVHLHSAIDALHEPDLLTVLR